MKKFVLALGVSLFAVQPVLASDWGYRFGNGAHRWGDISPDYALCKTGQEQSPINISAFLKTDLPALTPSYQAVPLEVANTGKSVQVNAAAGGFVLNGNAYRLEHVHFHTPSEHYIDGAPYPMELHMVHKSDGGALAVIGVMLKVGEHNPVIEGIWQNVPAAGEAKPVSGVSINPADLLPSGRDYYMYDGSLTTPPCSEGVTWFVMKDSITLSPIQLKAFQAVFPVNARPINLLNDRVVRGN